MPVSEGQGLLPPGAGGMDSEAPDGLPWGKCWDLQVPEDTVTWLGHLTRARDSKPARLRKKEGQQVQGLGLSDSFLFLGRGALTLL